MVEKRNDSGTFRVANQLPDEDEVFIWPKPAILEREHSIFDLYDLILSLNEECLHKRVCKYMFYNLNSVLERMLKASECSEDLTTRPWPELLLQPVHFFLWGLEILRPASSDTFGKHPRPPSAA